MALLDVANLHVRYGRIHGTSGVSFAVENRQTLALVGANGAGKSSTLKAILGMVPYSEGEILFDGRRLKGLKPSQIARLGLSYSPEGRRVFAAMSVQENLRVGSFSRPGAESAERLEQIYGYFPRLRERSRQRASSLSGGEQQMLAIGRALMLRPRLFLLDEPSLGLAPIIIEKIGDILREVQASEGISVVFAEQNANWALSLASHAVILELGKTIVAGPAHDLLRDPQMRRAYFGV